MLTKSGKLGLGIALVVAGIEFGKAAGDEIVKSGFGDKWSGWIQDTLGGWTVDFLADMKTGTFIEQLNAAGNYMGLTILAGVVYPFKKMFDFAKFIGDKIAEGYNAAKDAAVNLGLKILDGLKSVFTFGWLKSLLGLDSEIARATGGVVVGRYLPEGGNRHKVTNFTRKASGGYIAGPGSETSDDIPAWLSNGEYVVNAKATRKWFGLLEAINSNRFATGGAVGNSRTLIDVSGSKEPFTIQTALNQTMAALTSDFGLLGDGVKRVAKSLGLDLSDKLGNAAEKLEDVNRAFDELSQGPAKTEDFGTSLSEQLQRVDDVAKTLGWDTLTTLNEKLDLLSSAQDELTQKYRSGELSFEDFGEQVSVVKTKFDEVQISLDSASSALDELANKVKEKKNITEPLADASDWLKLDDATGNLVSDFSSVDGALGKLVKNLVASIAGFDSVAVFLAPTSLLLKGFMDVLSPIFKLLQPFANILISLGRLFGAIVNVVQPLAAIFGVVGSAVTYVIDSITLGIDSFFRFLDKLPVIGLFVNPILTEDQRKEMETPAQDRLNDSVVSQQSTTGTTFSAGSSQNITNNFIFEFKENQILTADDESVRHFSDLVWQNLLDRGILEGR